VVALGVSSSIGNRERRVGEKTQMLARIDKLTQGYRAAEAERTSLEAKLKGPPVQLMSYVSQVGARLGVDVPQIKNGTAGGNDKVVEETVEVDLARLDLPKLARLLEEL